MSEDTANHTDDQHNPNIDSDAQAAGKLVPVTEAIRYRKRAQAAEQQLGELTAQFESLQSQLTTAHQAVEQLERRQKIDALLAESDAIDIEAARLLTEKIVTDMDEPDVAEAVEDLRRHKPYLFRQQLAMGTAMAARVENEADVAEQAAQQAMTTGSRRDLLQYLRMRRK